LISGGLIPGCKEAPKADGFEPLVVMSVFGEVGVNPGQFTYPRVLTNDGKDLWVIDKSARVQRIEPGTGKSTALWTMPEWTVGKPCGAGVGPDGLLYVADTHYFRVMVYRPPGGLREAPELVSTFGSMGQGPGEFTYLTDVGILASDDGKSVERLYVGEYGGNDRISVFDEDHKFLFAFGSYGSSADAANVQFSRPQGIEVDKTRHEVVVTDSCNHRIGVFDLDGKLKRWISSPENAGQGPGQFAYPYGLVLLGDGTALVTEFGNHRVHHVDYEDGKVLEVYGHGGRGKGELTNPWAVTVMGDVGYVLDSGSDRIQSFKLPAKKRETTDLRASGSGLREVGAVDGSQFRGTGGVVR